MPVPERRSDRNHMTCAMRHADPEKKATPPLVQDAQDLGFKVKVREASEPLSLDHSSLIRGHRPPFLHDFLSQSMAYGRSYRNACASSLTADFTQVPQAVLAPDG